MSTLNNDLTPEEIELYKEFYDECDLDSDGFIDKRGTLYVFYFVRVPLRYRTNNIQRT